MSKVQDLRPVHNKFEIMERITTGCLGRAIAGDLQREVNVQVTEVKVISAGAGGERFRLTLWDNVQNAQGMLASQMAQMVKDNEIAVGSIITLHDYTSQNLAGVPIFVILSASVVGFAEAVSHHQQHQQQQPQAAPPASAPYGQQQQQSSYGQQPGYPPSHQQPQSLNMPQYGLPTQPMPTPNLPYPPQAQTQYGNPYGNVAPPPSVGGYMGQANSKPVIRDDTAGLSIVPIANINPYTNKWTIKAKITNKSNIREWSNAKGSGKLFSIDLIDNEGTEIRATFFKEACDKWFYILEQGKVYTFSVGTLKVGNKNFSSIKNNYELTFDMKADIRECRNDDDTIRGKAYAFVKISQINQVDANTVIDVVGIVMSATMPSSIVSQKAGGKDFTKRDITILDDTNFEIKVTLWSEQAKNPVWDSVVPGQYIVAFKGVKVSDYGGRSLGAVNSTNIAVNDMSIPEVNHLLHWFQSGGSSSGSHSLSTGSSMGKDSIDSLEKRRTLASIKEDNLGLSEKGDYFCTKASVNFVKKDGTPWYDACPDCKKKVTEMGGNWHCQKCDKPISVPSKRYILSCCMVDHTGSTWFSLFHDQALVLLDGITAEELSEHQMNGEQSMYERKINSPLFRSFVMKCRAKVERNNDKDFTKCTILNIQPTNWVSDSYAMLDAIAKYQI